jgi:hypothetical protein
MNAERFGRNEAVEQTTVRCLCGKLIAKGQSYIDHVYFCPVAIAAKKRMEGLDPVYDAMPVPQHERC